MREETSSKGGDGSHEAKMGSTATSMLSYAAASLSGGCHGHPGQGELSAMSDGT